MDPFAKPAEVERPKFFQSSNGDLVEVTDSIIEACYTIKCLISGHGRMVFKNSLGGAFIYENNRVIHQKEQKIMATLLQNDAERLLIYVHDVRTPILRRLLDFIAYHQQDVTERERKAWNATFIEQCSQILCELASVRILCLLCFSCQLSIAFHQVSPFLPLGKRADKFLLTSGLASPVLCFAWVLSSGGILFRS